MTPHRKPHLLLLSLVLAFAPMAARGEVPPEPNSPSVSTETAGPESSAPDTSSQPAGAAAPQNRTRAFSPGEELVYKVTALGMTAGKARITVGHATNRDGTDAWPVVVQARTDSIFDKVYTVRDRFVTWWHPETDRVIGADFYADEGGKKHRSMSKIDHSTGKAEVLRILDWKGGERTRRSYDVPPGAYDIAGAIMALRGRPLVPGTIEEIDVFTGKKTFKLRCIVERVEKRKTGAGTFDAIATRIQLGFDGNFASKRDLLAWFSNDERRVPLRVEAEFALGSIVADLLESRKGISL